MSKEVVVVSLDGVVWSDSLIMRTARVMRSRQMIPRSVPIRHQHDAMREISRHGVRDQHHNRVQAVAHKAVELCMESLNHRVVADIQSLSSKRHKFVALSSAPHFTVRVATEELQKQAGIGFATFLASEFTMQRNRYTGEYQPLRKQEAIEAYLNENGLEQVELAYINGRKDIEWAGELCRGVIAVNPGVGLQDHLQKPDEFAQLDFSS